jgi:uncharacterized protein (DUF488 family)
VSEAGPADPPPLYSIGHSNHPWETFLGLLQRHEIQVLADVRSAPYSKYSPHFDRRPLEAATREAGLEFVYLGRELGGRPDGDEYYDEDGHVRYWRRAQAAEFLTGIERLERGRARYRIAMMCSEEDPAECHRHLLIARVLGERGVAVAHIRGDGRLQAAGELESPQLAMFGELEESAWRSTRSVSPRGPRPTSSEP